MLFMIEDTNRPRTLEKNPRKAVIRRRWEECPGVGRRRLSKANAFEDSISSAGFLIPEGLLKLAGGASHRNPASKQYRPGGGGGKARITIDTARRNRLRNDSEAPSILPEP